MDLDFMLWVFVKCKFFNSIQVVCDGEEVLVFLLCWVVGEIMLVVILLDINLFKVNGLDVLWQIKLYDQFCCIFVVMLILLCEYSDFKVVYDLGVNFYIEKLVSFSKFIEVVGQIEFYWCVFNEWFV